MAKELVPLPSLASADMESITQFLQFLKEPETYKARLDALESMRKEVNALIETHGKIEEIEKLRAEAVTDREAAGKILEDAKRIRESVDEYRNEQLAALRTELDEKRSAADERLLQREDALRDGEAALRSREAACATFDREIRSREDRAAAEMKEGLALKEKYTEGIRAIREALEAASRAV